MTEDEAIARLQAHIATPVPLSPEEQAALDRAMKNQNAGDSVYNHRGLLVL